MGPFTSEINDAYLRMRFPDIYEAEARKAILDEGTVIQVKEGEQLIDIGQYIKSMPLVLEGSLKVLREDTEGNELLLYYILPGETCAMSLTCCMGDSRSTVRAVADEDTLALAIPVKLMDEWTTRYRSFKSFVMQAYQRRYEELLRTIDGIAFQKLDDRLLLALREKVRKQGSNRLQITHQELANELNSSREVISRLLKQMERSGTVVLGRNRIEILSQ